MTAGTELAAVAAGGGPRAWMSWSSGKDSALALHEVRAAGDVEVVGLLTTVNAEAGRVAMHGVRRSLLDAQADALGLRLHVVDLPWPCSDETYQERMAAAVADARADDVEVVVFGDLFLEDIRRYREEMLAGSGLSARFPLWRRPTDAVAGQLVALGVRAVVTCVDLRRLPRELAGRWYDEAFLADLPPGVDPCGENGEFHTLVVAAPGFARPLDVTVGETLERDGFAYADVLPAATPPGARR
ncbi:MAG TPA: hypothetical protein VHB02_08315 [Acidimicrobiales bacterium]|nr:hypothetical protein [Acidimicrobiales bacterium]